MQPWANAVHPEVVGDGCGRRAAASLRRSGAARTALRPPLCRPLNANVRSRKRRNKTLSAYAFSASRLEPRRRIRTRSREAAKQSRADSGNNFGMDRTHRRTLPRADLQFLLSSRLRAFARVFGSADNGPMTCPFICLWRTSVGTGPSGRALSVRAHRVLQSGSGRCGGGAHGIQSNDVDERHLGEGSEEIGRLDLQRFPTETTP